MKRSSNGARGMLVLALAAACWGFGNRSAADGPKASWTASLWPWSSKKVPEGQKDAAGQPVSDTRKEAEAARRLRAELDWKRRAEVCQKLRQIAYETKDEELDRYAERLDQRAWDVYVRQLGTGAATFDRVGADFNLSESKSKTREGQR